MPYGDGTGPMGRGPRTGRRAGYCEGYPQSGFLNPYTQGHGMGRGRGAGRGNGRRTRWFWRRRSSSKPEDYPDVYPPLMERAPPQDLPREDEMKYLDKLAEALESELKEIQERLKELSAKPDEKY